MHTPRVRTRAARDAGRDTYRCVARRHASGRALDRRVHRDLPQHALATPGGRVRDDAAAHAGALLLREPLEGEALGQMCRTVRPPFRDDCRSPFASRSARPATAEAGS